MSDSLSPLPRWMVLYKKGDTAFHLKFNQMEEMLLAIMNAKAIGFKVKVMHTTCDRLNFES